MRKSINNKEAKHLEELYKEIYNKDCLFYIKNEESIINLVKHAASIVFFDGTIVIDVNFPFVKIVKNKLIWNED